MDRYTAPIGNENSASSQIHSLCQNGPYLKYTFRTVVLVFTCWNMCSHISAVNFLRRDARNGNRHTATLGRSRISSECYLVVFAKSRNSLYGRRASFVTNKRARRFRCFFEGLVYSRKLFLLFLLDRAQSFYTFLMHFPEGSPTSAEEIQSSYRL